MPTKIHNPILTGFNPDPSICFVGGTYYIATSTFEWFPGVQIHSSEDLLNWRLVKRPLERLSQLNMSGNRSSGGIWAPCLSHDGEKFHLIYTDVKIWAEGEAYKDCHNYLTTCETVDGNWSDPVYMNSSGFDASLFHDEDGKKWFVNMEWDYRKPTGTAQFSGILLQEYSPAEKRLVGEAKKIFRGTPRGLVEGPHIFKRNGYYYLICAEGGTSYQHAESVSRSRNIDGSYEIRPEWDGLLIDAFQKGTYIKKTGHGQLVENDRGEWYFVHLCGRPLPDDLRCPLGRETSIQKIIWKDDWCYLSDADGNITNTPQDYIEVEADIPQKADGTRLYRFDSNEFLRDFQSLRVPINHLYSLKEREGYLRLYGRESVLSRHEQALFARRQTDFSFVAETAIECRPQSFQQMAGLTYRYDESTQYYFRVSFDEEKNAHTVGLLQFDRYAYKFEETEIDFDGKIRLCVETRNHLCRFLYSLDGESYVPFGGERSSAILSDDHVFPMGFTGAFVGMQVTDQRGRSFFADFEYFEYRPL